MKFKIGQKVVCIGLPPRMVAIVRMKGVTCPVADRIYTIRGGDYFPADMVGDTSGNGYLLEEIVNPRNAYSVTHRRMQELYFDEEYFRPLVDTSAEVERLKRLQNPANHQNWGDGDFPGVPTRKEKVE